MCHRSSDGSPSWIHSAITLPIPPAPARPCAQNPAATNSPRTSVSPRQNSSSGVNASGPLMSLVTFTSSIAGTRRRALTTISSKRSQSSSSRRPLKSGGMRSTRCSSSDHGAHGARSRPSPAPRPPRGSRRAGRGRASSAGAATSSRSRNGWVTTYSCAIGTIGTRTPASRPISAANMPARVDDDLRLDVAPLRRDTRHRAVRHGDPRHARVGEDAAAALPRALGQRVRQLRRVEVAVGRQERPRRARRRRSSAGTAPAPPTR